MRTYLSTVSLLAVFLSASASMAQAEPTPAPIRPAPAAAPAAVKRIKEAAAKRAAKAKEPEKAAADDAPIRPNVPAEIPPGAGDAPPTSMESIAERVDTPYRPQAGGTLVKFNLEDADLAELVNHISGLTGKRFIYGAKVRQIKVTVVSPTPVTIDEAYEAFLSILDSNGMTVVPHGRFLKIIDSAGVVNKDTPIYSRGAPIPNSDRMITRLYRLKHVLPSEVNKVLVKFKSKDGDITPYDEGQLLILTDTGTQVQRMIRMIEEIDLGSPASKMWIEPVNYGTASDLAKQLNELYELGKPGGSASGLEKVIADDQTNSLIVVGNDDSYLRLLELLKRIDSAPAADGRIHVLPLQHADAEELSKTLTRMLTGAGGGAAPAGAKKDALGEMFEGELRITADQPTNSLVISSSPRDFAQLRMVLNDLDKQRRQVFLEAVIMDVSVERSNEITLAYHGGVPGVAGDDTLLLGGFNAIKSISLPVEQLQALALGVRGPAIEGSQSLTPLGISIPGFGLFLNAIANSGDSNVLSTPHIIALDNTQAEINVGENVPLQTNVAGGISQAALGGAAGAAALGGGFNFNAQRTDVGTKIKITPHINDKNQVRLEIEEEISETGAPVGQLGAVPITKRTAKTTVVVDDQQTVVIGGLMRDAKVKSSDKIPVLGDLPVLGVLFRSSKEKMRKTNLLLILTPHVIREQSDLRQVFEKKMQERQEFIDRYFVFTSDWTAPRDFSRTDGLVETIRKAFVELEERELIEEEGKRGDDKLHEPTPPLELAGEVKAGAGGNATRRPKRNNITVTPPSGGKKKPASKPAKRAAPKKRSDNESPLLLRPLARSIAPSTANAPASIPGPSVTSESATSGLESVNEGGLRIE